MSLSVERVTISASSYTVYLYDSVEIYAQAYLNRKAEWWDSGTVVRFELYVDGELRDSQSVPVEVGKDEVWATFTYTFMELGRHRVQVRAEAIPPRWPWGPTPL